LQPGVVTLEKLFLQNQSNKMDYFFLIEIYYSQSETAKDGIFLIIGLNHLQTILVPQTGQCISGHAFPCWRGIVLPQDGQTHFEAIEFTFS
jgi:hypothetical protein